MANYLTEFIPEIWSAKILEDKKKRHIFGGLANTDYVGEIKNAGDQVRIPQLGLPTVNSYTRNNAATGLTLEYVNSASLTLVVDQEKYVNIGFDEVDVVQSGTNFIPQLQKNIAYKLADTQDVYIGTLATMAGITTTSNSASTRVQLASSNVKTEFLLMGKEFDEANCARAGRWAAISPALQFELIDAGILEQSNNDITWGNGFVGRAYGFDLYVTNNLYSSNTSSVNIMFGLAKESITIAEQVTRVEMKEFGQEMFGQYIKALHVYGARMIPDRSGIIYAYVDNS